MNDNYGYQWGNIALFLFVFLVMAGGFTAFIFSLVKAYKKERREARTLKTIEALLKGQDIVNRTILEELRQLKELNQKK